MLRICSPSRGEILLGGSAPPSCDVTGFAARNAVPCVIGAVVDVAVIAVVRHPVLVIGCTALVVAVAASAPLLSRLLLRAMGSLVVPAGYERLNPGRAEDVGQEAVVPPSPVSCTTQDAADAVPQRVPGPALQPGLHDGRQRVNSGRPVSQVPVTAQAVREPLSATR